MRRRLGGTWPAAGWLDARVDRQHPVCAPVPGERPRRLARRAVLVAAQPQRRGDVFGVLASAQYEAGCRHVVHEAFLPGQIVGINCVAPPSIPEEDLWALFRLAGKYKGLSPFRPGEYGQFEVESIVARRVMSRPQQKEETERTASGGLDSIEKPPIVETNFI
jgi:hypothetical protein